MNDYYYYFVKKRRLEEFKGEIAALWKEWHEKPNEHEILRNILMVKLSWFDYFAGQLAT